MLVLDAELIDTNVAEKNIINAHVRFLRVAGNNQKRAIDQDNISGVTFRVESTTTISEFPIVSP